MRFLHLFFSVTIFLWTTSPAYGADLAGASFPESITLDGKTLVLNGLGLRTKTVFDVHVYVAALYLPKKMQTASEIFQSSELKRLDIQFLRDVTVDDINTSWDEGLELNCQTKCDIYKERMEKLKSLSRDLKKGQTVSFVFYKDKLETRMDTVPPVTIEGKDFVELILSNFIGVPPSEAVKTGLLGIKH